MLWLGVAIGGGLGAVVRAWISFTLLPLSSFPIATLAVNALGSFAIGCCWIWFSRYSASAAVTGFVMTGFLGGFTTFSTFSLESLQLLQQEHYGTAATYVALSLLLCLAGVAAGAMLTKWLV